jgi:hypothetical protein
MLRKCLLFVVAILCLAGQLAAQDTTRVRVIRLVPFTGPDTTGLVHAPTTLVEVNNKEPRAAGACALHLRDPAINVNLLLVASNSNSTSSISGDTLYITRVSVGDYEFQQGKAYGLTADELLRVDCARDRPIGKVPRPLTRPR